MKKKTLLSRYFIQLAYKGTHYMGWQIQPGMPTVQETLNNALSKLLRNNIYVVGAGRTDTGVHATKFFAHFDSTEQNLNEDDKFIYQLNSILPKDIAVYKILKVTPEAHTRFSAISRTYKYYILKEKDPFLQEFAWFYARKLNVDLMNKAASHLLNYADFTSFSKLHTDVKTNNCKIYEAFWVETQKEIIFQISADRFLRNMVRAIVGTLFWVGSGKISTEKFMQIVENKNRSEAGISVEAKGLHLIDIKYPDNIYL